MLTYAIVSLSLFTCPSRTRFCRLFCICMYICTSKASKVSTYGVVFERRDDLLADVGHVLHLLLCQCVYCCTSKAVTCFTTLYDLLADVGHVLHLLLRQCVYCCTSKASKLSTSTNACRLSTGAWWKKPCHAARQHTSAYVGIRQHTPAYVSIRQHTSAGRSPASRASSICFFFFV